MKYAKELSGGYIKMKILYVTTVSSTMMFFTSHINMLLDQGHTVDLACNFDLPINPQLLERGCNVFDIEFQRSPIKKENYTSLKHLKKLIIENDYDIVHTHTPIASVCVRLACKNMKKVKVIYTAHGFHFFKGAPLKNWLIYYPIERLLAKYTDVLITINKEDYSRANKSFRAGCVEYIPGVGLDTKKIFEVIVDKSAKREEIGVPKGAFVILSVGELNKNKNHETIIKAVAKLKNPNIYYVICGMGSLDNYLKNLARELGLDKKVKLLGFRKDIVEICKASDIFAFPSKREGLGLAALEAMSTGLPIITSSVHGIVDYSIDGETGFSCSPTDVDGFAKAIEKMTKNEDMRSIMCRNNILNVKKYDVEYVKNDILNIYNKVINDVK
jgi:glycosyltransferase involved in cell wall biosynthesis